MKKILALLLAAMMLVAAFAGCAAQNNNEASKPSGWVNDYFTALPTTLNTFVSGNTEVYYVVRATSINLYRSYLTDSADSYEYLPELASELPIQMDEEGKVWQIKLRQGQKFSNGLEITADDVLYTYEMLLDPNQLNVKATQIANATSITIVNAAAYFAGECSWEDVGMKKIDDYTIEITNVEPTTQLNVTRTIGVGTIVCKELYKSLLGDDGTWTGYGMTADQYVSSGAFILKEWIPDAKIVLERNPDFVFADKIKIEGITFIAIPDAQTALELFVKGEIDAVDISYEHWENYAEDPRVYNYYDDSLMYMFVNMGNPNQNNLLGKLNFREALYYGLDRVAIGNAISGEPVTRYVRKGVIGDPATGTAYVNMPGANDFIDDPMTVYNPTKANEFFTKALEECNLTSATLELMYSEVSTRTRSIWEMAQVQWKDVFNGKLQPTMRSVPAGQTITLRRWNPSNPTAFEITLGSMLPDADDPSQSFHCFTSTYSPPRFYYSNPEFDALYDQAVSREVRADNDKFIDICQKMEKIILEDRVIIPVYETVSKKLFADKIDLPTANDQYVTCYGFGYPYYVSIK
ncbi:MAG: hypothetical protein IJF14_03430 [Clostridia bacterium]|nr:hypothetical protein [Clostridia bacterium]